MSKNTKHVEITIRILRTTANIWIQEAEKHNMTLEDFIAKVLLDYKLNKK